MFFCDQPNTKSRCGRIILALILLALYGCAYSPPKAQYGGDGIPVLFTCKAPGAKKVFLAGSFNYWSTSALPMNREGADWSITIGLPKGRYQYAFLVDGFEWRLDPGAQMFEDNDFGTPNSILIVE